MNTIMTMNPTIQKFGHPGTLIADLGHWIVLLRPRQVTLGSLILAANHDATSFGDLPPGHMAALGPAVAKIERGLRATLGCDKFNYLMLMMVDPHVHFHVIPRYSKAATFGGQSYLDSFWPGPPDVTKGPEMDAATFEALRKALAGAMG